MVGTELTLLSHIQLPTTTPLFVYDDLQYYQPCKFLFWFYTHLSESSLSDKKYKYFNSLYEWIILKGGEGGV